MYKEKKKKKQKFADCEMKNNFPKLAQKFTWQMYPVACAQGTEKQFIND